MCRLVTVCYTCPEPCGYNQSAWETQCQYTGRDNLQGGCGRTDNAGIRQLTYPCPHHRGLDFDFIAGNVIRQSGYDTGGPTWRLTPDSGAVPSQAVAALQRGMRSRWEAKPDLYERDPGMPEDLRRMTNLQWAAYLQNIHHPRASGHGLAYSMDPHPWGDARIGGPLPPFRSSREWQGWRR